METQTTSTEKTLLDTVFYYLAIWFRYKWLVLITTFVVTSAVVAYCIVSIVLPPSESPMPNYYTAYATILIKQSTQNDMSNSILSALGVEASGVPVSRSFDYGSQIMEMMRSRTIIDRLIEELDLANSFSASGKEKLRAIVLLGFQFSYSQTTGMMGISYMDSDPVFAQKMVNRMISLLDEWYNLNRNLARQKQQLLLEEKITAVKKDITTMRNRLKTIPDIDPNYSQYISELDIQQRIYDTLSPQYEAAKLAPEIEPIFQVFELAEVPETKTGPKRQNYVFMAFGGSFAGSSALALLIDMLKSILRTRSLKKKS